MLEVLQFYVSGVWTWLGLTCGLFLLVVAVAAVADVVRGLVAVAALGCKRQKSAGWR